jgi:hypothetical protein
MPLDGGHIVVYNNSVFIDGREVVGFLSIKNKNI